jgi:hypothetical protein
MEWVPFLIWFRFMKTLSQRRGKWLYTIFKVPFYHKEHRITIGIGKLAKTIGDNLLLELF